jgi:hypothetical protein
MISPKPNRCAILIGDFFYSINPNAHLCARHGFTFIYKATPYCAKKNKQPTRVVLFLSVAIQPQKWNPISAVRVRGVT